MAKVGPELREHREDPIHEVQGYLSGSLAIQNGDSVQFKPAVDERSP